MTPQVPFKRSFVPSRRTLGALAAVTGLILGLLSVIAALGAGSAAAGTSAVHNTVAHRNDVVADQLLARLAKAQGVRGRHNPAPTGSPTTPTSAPTSSATPTPAPTSSSPSAPSTPTPTDPVTNTPPSTDPGDPGTGGSQLVWSDEFNGSAGSPANPSDWQASLGGRWGGGSELECYTNDRANSALDGNGDLVITARYDPGHQCTDATNNYTSARLTTQNLVSAKYGQIRVRAKVPSASGVWPAIWLLGTDNDQVGWPNAGEMDMMEAVGQDDTTVYGTIHGPGSNGNWQMGSAATASSPIDTNFHVYGLDWSPTRVVLSLDGKVYKTITKTEVTSQGDTWVFDRPFFLLLNVAVGGQWPGNPNNNSVFPSQTAMTVDYVRVYK